MKLDRPTNEIKYDETVGTVARFVVILDGEPTMRIACDMADDKRTIRIAAVNPVGEVLHDTKGRFELTSKLTEDPDGMPLGAEQRVDRISVYRYVIPRLHVLLGRLLRAA